MKTTNCPNSFVASLASSSKVNFENGILKAEISRIMPRNSKREILIRYSENVGGQWRSYSSCTSPFASDIQEDFLTECKIFSISN